MSTHRTRILLLSAAALVACLSPTVSPGLPPATAAPDTAAARFDPRNGSPGQLRVARPRPVEVQVLAFNDFHGRLEASGLYLNPATGGASSTDPGAVPAGGTAYLAAHLAAHRQENPNTAVVSVGDLFGVSRMPSGYFHDEPTVEAMNEIGLTADAIGNHDFDEGLAELRRLRDGGCHPVDGCRFREEYTGARYPMLGANILDSTTGAPVFPEYVIKDFGPARVAFVGVDLKYTPTLVPTPGIAGLRFAGEAATVRALVPRLRAAGADAIVVLLHAGAAQSADSDINDCRGITGSAVTITKQWSGLVDAVVSGHTHKAYRCVVGGTSLTSAASHGRAFTRLSLRIDPAANRVLSVSARNHVVTRDLTPDSRVDAIVRRARTLVRPVAQEVLVRQETTLTRTRNDAGESAVGALVADAQLAATRSATTGGAQLAIVQQAALGADLRKGTVSYEKAYNVQPFGHRLVTMTLTGDQLDAALEQQYCKKTAMTNDHRISLQVSQGLNYRWDPAAPCGNRVSIADIRLDGVPVTGATGYRVTVNELLASGGQGITAFAGGTERVTGPFDVQALAAYLTSTGPVPVPDLPRIELGPPVQEVPPTPGPSAQAPSAGSTTEWVPTP